MRAHSCHGPITRCETNPTSTKAKIPSNEAMSTAAYSWVIELRPVEVDQLTQPGLTLLEKEISHDRSDYREPGPYAQPGRYWESGRQLEPPQPLRPARTLKCEEVVETLVDRQQAEQCVGNYRKEGDQNAHQHPTAKVEAERKTNEGHNGQDGDGLEDHRVGIDGPLHPFCLAHDNGEGNADHGGEKNPNTAVFAVKAREVRIWSRLDQVNKPTEMTLCGGGNRKRRVGDNKR